METVAVAESPFDLYPSRTTAPPGDASMKAATLVCCAAASTCSGCPSASTPALPAASPHPGAAPAWLSVAVTCMLEVVVQVAPGAAAGTFAARLAECRGVKATPAQPLLCRLKCRNVADLCALHGGLVALPLSPAVVVAADVCACSAGIRAAPMASEVAAQSKRPGQPRPGDGVGSAASPVTSAAAPSQTAAAPTSDTAADSELTRVVRCIPTIALVLRFPQRCRRALLLLRPAVVLHKTRHVLAYRSSLHPLSESVQRVALSPHGDAALVLGDVFVQDTESDGIVSSVASAKGADKQATLLLHGGYLRLDSDGDGAAAQHAALLRPLVLHLGLCGASACSTTLRALLRCRATGAWCRPTVGETSGTEVVLHTSDGHVLVFEPVAVPAGGCVAEGAAAPVLYTCCTGGRLSFAPSDSAAGVSDGRNAAAPVAAAAAVVDALLVAPPWRFADRWRHSPWLAGALSRQSGAALVAGPLAQLADGEPRPHRHRRHRTSAATVATSANRRVWLLRAGDALYLASVPCSGGAHSGALLLTAAVQLEAAYALHDAVYLDCGGHPGFLLLCRHTSMGAVAAPDHAAAASGGSMLDGTVGGGRFVHAAQRGPVRLFFLSLLMVPGGAASAPLLPLPVHPTSALLADALPTSFTHPSSRLRLVSATAVADLADTALVVLGSSGAAGVAWVGAVRVPCVWTWCVARRLDRATAGSAVVRQWSAHAFNALLPHAASMARDAAVPLSADAAGEQVTADVLLEGALLELHYPYAHDAFPGADDVGHGRGASHYAHSTIAFHEALHALLHAGDAGTGARTHPAGAAAVFAGFADALRMSGLLRVDQAAPRAATMGFVAFLHGCAQPLRHALEDVAAAGEVSALLTCASHLARTAAAAADAASGAPSSVATALEVWRRLLYPLFDFVWGVVQAYGVSADVSGDVLAYCSPTVRSMANARRVYWPNRSTAASAQRAAGAVTPPPAELAASIAAAAPGPNSGPASARAAGGEVPSSSAHNGLPPPSTASGTSPYTSAELYEVVRRVFLMQGATAAMQLLGELQKHERTRGGVAEMAHLFEAMQQRLQRAAA